MSATFFRSRRVLLGQAGALGLATLAWPARAHGDAAHPGATARSIDPTQHGWGRQGDPARVARRLHIGMSDRMRFDPARFQVRVGQTLALIVHNRGRLPHELVIGTRDELQRHAELMRQHPGMEHDEPYMAHVAPGRQAELVWEFNRPGQFLYGCLVAGHWDAGMVGTIDVKE